VEIKPACGWNDKSSGIAAGIMSSRHCLRKSKGMKTSLSHTGERRKPKCTLRTMALASIEAHGKEIVRLVHLVVFEF
jgi:hypothetical protein